MTTTLTQLPNVYFSLNGYLTKLPPPKALATIRAVPLERCLLESDAPDGALHLSEAWLEALPELEQVRGMAEESKHDSGNSPKVVLCTLRLVAAAMGRPEGEVAAATYQNAHKIFCSHLAQSGNG